MMIHERQRGVFLVEQNLSQQVAINVANEDLEGFDENSCEINAFHAFYVSLLPSSPLSDLFGSTSKPWPCATAYRKADTRRRFSKDGDTIRSKPSQCLHFCGYDVQGNAMKRRRKLP